MDFINYASNWFNEEITQGKIMIILGVLLLVSGLFIWRGSNDMLRGMLIPFSLVVIILLGYGSYQAIKRPKQLKQLILQYEQTPEAVLKAEVDRTFKEKDVYLKFKIAWVMLNVMGIALLFIFKQPYFKGLSLGIIIFSISALTIDSILEQRVKDYYWKIEVFVKGNQ